MKAKHHKIDFAASFFATHCTCFRPQQYQSIVLTKGTLVTETMICEQVVCGCLSLQGRTEIEKQIFILPTCKLILAEDIPCEIRLHKIFVYRILPISTGYFSENACFSAGKVHRRRLLYPKRGVETWFELSRETNAYGSVQIFFGSERVKFLNSF